MSLILKQESASSIPTPASGKSTLFVDSTSSQLQLKQSNGGVTPFPTLSTSNTQVVFNDSGNFGGSTSFVYANNTSTLTVANLSVTGTLSAGDISVSSIANGTSNVDIVGVSGNVTVSVGGNANILTVTGTGTNIAGYLNANGIVGNGIIGGAKTSGSTRGTGVTGQAYVTSSSDSGAAVGVRGYATDTHVGGYNIGVLGNATGSGTGNYAFYVQNGGIASIENTTAWDLYDNSSTAIVWQSSGKANILGIDTTDSAEGVYTSGYLSVSGNANIGNIGTAGLITATGNVRAGNLVTPGVISATGNANIGNIGTAGLITATGNIGGGNINTAGLISAIGNIYGGNLNLTGGISSNGEAVTGDMDVTGITNLGTGNANWLQIFGGTLRPVIRATGSSTAGLIFSSTGTGNYIFNSDSSFVQGTSTGLAITAYGQNYLDVRAGGSAQPVTLVASGGDTNIDFAVTPKGSGNVTTSANLSVTGNGTFGNVSATTFTGSLSGTATSALNATTAGTVTTALQPNITSVGTLANLSVAGNANIGNIGTAGLITATGNLNAGNIITAGVVSATGNGTFGNVSATLYVGNLSGTGNSNVGNLGTTALVATGSGSFGANVNMNSHNINNLAAPSADADAATKLYVDTIASTGISYHPAVNAATTTTLATTTGGTMTYNNGTAGVNANLVTTGSFTTVDGVNIASVGARILVKNEANAAWNGVYTYANSTTIVRATDADTYGPGTNQLSENDYFFIQAGSVNIGSAYVCSTSGTIIFGTTNITFAQFSSSQVYSNGTGLGLTNTTFSVNASQTQVTAVGTLTSLSVSGNANIGNVGATTFVGNLSGTTSSVSGNANVGNLGTVGLITATGNIGGGNINTTGIVSAGGNVIGGNKLLIGISATSLTNPVAVFSSSGSTYVQAAVLNTTGTGSSDLVTYGNNGDDTQSWTDIGFTGNTFNDPNYTVTAAGDGYLFVQGNSSFGGNLVIATGNTGTTKDIIFATGGFLTGNIKARLYNANGAFSVAGNVVGGNVSGTLLTGTLTTAAQPNITSVGTLASLTVSTTISGSVSGTAATVTTAAQPNITSLGTLSALTVGSNGAMTTTNLTSGANTTQGYLTGNWVLTAGSRWNATYADLSEKYVADATYDPGTVLIFGGECEVTISNELNTTRVAGVVTTDAAYTMNSGLQAEHVADIALQGRVPVKVIGPIYKGDLLVSAGNGHAIANNDARAGTIIGKSLQNFTDSTGVIEVAVGRF